MSHFSLRVLVAGILACAVPAFGQIIDGFESYPLGNLPPQGGWNDFGGSQGIVVSNAQAHSGTQSMRLSEGTDTQGGTTTGYGSDVWKNFLAAGTYTSGTVIFSYWQFIENAVDSVSFNYISTKRLPVATGFQTGLDLRGDPINFFTFGNSMLIVQDIAGQPTLVANPVPLVKGRWVEHSMTINLTANTYTYSYDGSQLVTNQQWDTTPGDGVGLGGINFWMQLGNADNTNAFVYYDDFNTVVPEPATAALSLLGLAGLVARRRRA